MDPHHSSSTPTTSSPTRGPKFDRSNISSQLLHSSSRADFSVLSRRLPLRSSARPSTAPAKQELTLLPSFPSGQVIPAMGRFPNAVVEPTTKKLDTFNHMQTVKEDEMDIPSSLSLGGLPSPFDVDAEDIVSLPHTDTPLPPNHPDYDWATFINAYASGRWDPHRTPNPPRSYTSSSSGFPLSSEAPSTASGSVSLARYTHHRPYNSDIKPDDPQTQSDPQSIYIQASVEDKPVTSPPAAVPSSTSTLSISPSSSLRRFRPAAPANLPLPTHRMRNSFSTSSAPLTSPGESATLSPSTAHSNSEVQTTVATLRWAAARVDISPLALPSPEHELTDPMRGITAIVPGSHPTSFDIGPDYPITPGGTRKTRLGSFWHGTTDVDKDGSPLNETLMDRSSETLVDSPVSPQRERSESLPTSFSVTADKITAASAPQAATYHGRELLPNDYFGTVIPRTHPPADTPTSSSDTNDDAQTTTGVAPGPAPVAAPQPLSPDLGTMSVPALPRRVCLTRQTSSPLPTSSPTHEPRVPGGRVPSEGIASIKVGRAAKEEQMFTELGYLAPPNPPDELERRRALYKFNIWNTGPDLNFDRIAHLAKLVFSTKGVMISLIDGNEQ
ncbi:hypothetical protein D9615_004279 [Tricholomella constricta]|uniref:Uncharacterized protein n=1 Tax=Tricholomella constricta TaxID=117010 RepID=A0A8H5M5J5_9AGAR|nr:hypothetical protein D9615_004279 [Tricholomella constricta]